MGFDRVVTVLGLIITAIAVSDRAEELYKRAKSLREQRVEMQRLRDLEAVRRSDNVIEFDVAWREISDDLRGTSPA